MTQEKHQASAQRFLKPYTWTKYAPTPFPFARSTISDGAFTERVAIGRRAAFMAFRSEVEEGN